MPDQDWVSARLISINIYFIIMFHSLFLYINPFDQHPGWGCIGWHDVPVITSM